MKMLDDIILDCTDAGTKRELQQLKESLEDIYADIESAEDYMSMCADATVYTDYLDSSNKLYELLYGEITL